MNDKNNPSETGEQAPASAPSYKRRAAYYGPAPYYGAATPPYYGGGAQPVPYGGSAPYGGTHYGAAPYAGVGEAGGEDGDSLLGAVTLTRMVRVCSQRWMTIAVVSVLGAVAAFALYRTMPSIYESTSVFEMNVRRPRILKMDGPYVDETQGGGAVDEIFNTRLAKLRSWDVVQEVIRRFRTDNPSSTMTDDDLLTTLSQNTDLALQRRTRLVRITIRSTNAEIAAALANAYALTVDAYALEENRTQSDQAVAWLKTTVEAQRRQLSRADQAIYDFRVANSIDSMESDRTSATAALQKLNADVVEQASQVHHSQDLVMALAVLQNDPDKFGALPDQAPRLMELREAYQKLMTAQTDRNVLLAHFTNNHPDVAAKEKEVEMLRQQFADEVGRCRETAKANLDLLSKQLDDSTKRCSELNAKTSELELKIVSAKMHLDALIREREVADLSFRGVLQREQEARLSTDENTATIKIVEKAVPNKKPVSPNPFIILPSGPIIGILVGIIFVLVLDHLEDKITGIPDVEARLRIKVLAVLPHIRRARREQVALLSAEDRFSHFAEAFAGLRNLLDAPRYAGVSKVILIASTQPSEGKTIAASNFALSCALSGQRTVLIDCDLRRPRIARVYGKGRKDFESLPTILIKNDPTLFSRVPVASGHPNLDLVCARPSSEISPSNLLGSGAVANFIDWARQNYDRVIIDSAPFGLVSDAVVLGTLADGIIVMCCPDRTRFGPLKHAIRHLSEVGGHIIGVLVNDVDFGRAGMFSRYDYHYHYSYRYKYGYKYGYGTRNAAALPAGTTAVAGEDPSAAADNEAELPVAPAPKKPAAADEDDE